MNTLFLKDVENMHTDLRRLPTRIHLENAIVKQFEQESAQL